MIGQPVTPVNVNTVYTFVNLEYEAQLKKKENQNFIMNHYIILYYAFS